MQRYLVPVRGILIFLLSWLYSTITAFQGAPFRVDLDFAQFRYDDKRNYIEIYYSYDESQLSYRQNENGEFEAGVLFNILISSTVDDSLLVNRWWRAPHVVADTSDLVQGKSFVGVIGMTNPKGHHLLKITTIDDYNRSRKYRNSYDLLEKSFGAETMTLSDLQLCSSIKKIPEDHHNIFYKNTFEVIPNPTSMYGMGGPVVFYYAEAYNLLAGEGTGEYLTKVSVYDSNNRELITERRSKPRISESSVEVGTINVNALPSGSYRLVFALIDSATNETVESTKSFLVYNPHQDRAGDKSTGFDMRFMVASDLGTMDEAGLDREFDVVRYIASRAEKSQYRRLASIDAKRDFLHSFWKRRDPDEQTAVNELRQEYMRRVQYANGQFGSGMKEGWKSDRGRVFIMYGEPSEYERYTSEVGTKPYEVWYYHTIQGGVEFVFVDLFGFQDYELVHSTHRDELQDYGWRAKIRE